MPTASDITSIIIRSITAADRAVLNDVKRATDHKTDSGAIAHVLRDYAAERERCNVAQRERHQAHLLILATAKAMQAHQRTTDELVEATNALLAYTAALA